jgi:hypothetical protein
MSNNETPNRERAKTYRYCAEELRTFIEYMEKDCGRLGHARLFVWIMEEAPVFMLVPDDPEAGRDASTRFREILGESESDGIEEGTCQ